MRSSRPTGTCAQILRPTARRVTKRSALSTRRKRPNERADQEPAKRFQVQTICEYFEDGSTPDDFDIQVQGQLLVTGRKWCDLISYSGGLPMITMRIEPNETIQAAILDAAAKFEARINEVVLQYQSALESGRLRLTKTERTYEQEMHL
jgi:hypothetical protein